MISGVGVNTPLILILEDQPDIRRLLKIILSRHGGRVMEAESIVQATALVEQNRFDLVFLDYMLPDGLGIDICKKLRALGGFTSIVMVTARSEVEVADRLLAAGASQVILKPFEPSAINEIMEAFARNHAERQH
jgi:DNA-binding response OmpR family regulator